MQWKDVERTLKENGRWLALVEYYDRTGRLPARKITRSFTLKQANFDRLKQEAARRGISMSALLDGMIEDIGI